MRDLGDLQPSRGNAKPDMHADSTTAIIPLHERHKGALGVSAGGRILPLMIDRIGAPSILRTRRSRDEVLRASIAFANRELSKHRDFARLVVSCKGCRTWWLSWGADLSLPFPEREVDPTKYEEAFEVVNYGGYYPDGHGRWVRWLPGKYASLPADEEPNEPIKTVAEYSFHCRRGCGTDPQVHVDKLESAANDTLRLLHTAGEKKPWIIDVDGLMRFAARVSHIERRG